MNYQKFKITSRIDENDYMLIEIDMDTINTDDPTMNLIEESLDICEHLLCPHSQEFVEAWEQDGILPLYYKEIATGEIQKITREKYTIELG